MSYHHFAFLPHPGHDKTEFPIAMGGLVKVHEVHVDGAPRYFRIELGMQVANGLAQNAKAVDPHLSRGKGMHPNDQPDTIFVRIGLYAYVGNLVRGLDQFLVNYFYWNMV